MKPLMIGISYEMKIVILVFSCQKYRFLFHLFSGHTEMEMNEP